jgi:DNA repair protein RadD
MEAIKAFSLRPYQQKAVDAAVEFFSSTRRFNAIQVLPTGAGKSLVIADTVKRIEGNTLIFQPSKEILEQNYDKIRAYGFDASIYSASLGSKNISKTTLATIGSVVRRPSDFRHFQNVIIDECHLVNSKGGMYKDFLEAIGNPKVLGLTATPYRLTTDGFGGSILKFLTRTRPRVFDEMIYYCQCRELYDAGFWSPLKYYPVSGFDTARIATNSTGAEYDDESVRAYYTEIDFASRLLDITTRLKKAARRGVLVFTRFIEESRFVVQNVPGAVTITGETPAKDRKDIIERFKSGQIPVVCNVGVLTTGFDYPELDTVLIARPTMSLALYYQMIGRAVRPHKDKKEAWIVDICDNYRRFGQVEHLQIDTEGNGKWFIRSGGKQLTNTYYN